MESRTKNETHGIIYNLNALPGRNAIGILSVMNHVNTKREFMRPLGAFPRFVNDFEK